MPVWESPGPSGRKLESNSSLTDPGATPVRSIGLVVIEPLNAPPLEASSNSSVSATMMLPEASVNWSRFWPSGAPAWRIQEFLSAATQPFHSSLPPVGIRLLSTVKPGAGFGLQSVPSPPPSVTNGTSGVKSKFCWSRVAPAVGVDEVSRKAPLSMNTE